MAQVPHLSDLYQGLVISLPIIRATGFSPCCQGHPARGLHYPLATKQGQPRINFSHQEVVSKWSQDPLLSIVLLPICNPTQLPPEHLLPFLAAAPSGFVNPLTNCAQIFIILHLQLQLSQLSPDARNMNLLPFSALWCPHDFSLTM